MWQKMKFFLSLLITIFYLPIPSQAQESGITYYLDGNKFKHICSNMDDRTLCAYYMIGVVETIGNLEMLKLTPCIIRLPKGVSGFQLLDLFLKYINNNPENKDLPAGSIAFIVLKKNFPCPSK